MKESAGDSEGSPHILYILLIAKVTNLKVMVFDGWYIDLVTGGADWNRYMKRMM